MAKKMVSETPRQAGLARKVFDVFLVDDSKSDDKTLDLKVSLFVAGRSFAALHADMKQTAKSSTAITFFDLQAKKNDRGYSCLLYTSPSPRDGLLSRMPSSA